MPEQYPTTRGVTSGRRLAALWLLLGCLAATGRAGDVGGAFSPKEWDGARAQGMGDAFVAVADDVSAMNSNPAGLAAMNHATAAFDYADLFGHGLIKTSALGAVFPTRWGTHGFDYRGFRVSFDPFPQKYVETTLGYSFGYAFGPLGLGTSLKYYGVSSDFTEGTASGMGLDLGARYQISDRWALGASVQNIYSSVKWGSGTSEGVPATWRIGGSFRITERWLAAAEYDGVAGAALDRLKFGTEYWILRPAWKHQPLARAGQQEQFFEKESIAPSIPVSLALRAGFQKFQTGRNTIAPTAGAGFGYGSVRLDYAFVYARDAQGNTHRYSLTYDFKPGRLGDTPRPPPTATTTQALPPPPVPSAVAKPVAPTRSFAVFDFANSTGEPANAWLEAGFADIVDRALAQKGLGVIPRNALQGTAALSGPEAIEQARRWGASLAVRGVFVRTAAGRVTLSARLIDVSSGRAVDRAEVEGDESAIFSLGQALASEIVAKAAALP